VGDRVKVVYHEGCKITIGGSWWDDEVVPHNPDDDRRTIAEAAQLAAEADAVVLAIGGNEQTSREAWMGNTWATAPTSTWSVCKTSWSTPSWRRVALARHD
jgi:hypothetical protein